MEVVLSQNRISLKYFVSSKADLTQKFRVGIFVIFEHEFQQRPSSPL